MRYNINKGREMIQVKKGDLIKTKHHGFGIVVKAPYNSSVWDDDGMMGLYSTYFDVLIPKTGSIISINSSLELFEILTNKTKAI